MCDGFIKHNGEIIVGFVVYTGQPQQQLMIQIRTSLLIVLDSCKNQYQLDTTLTAVNTNFRIFSVVSDSIQPNATLYQCLQALESLINKKQSFK